MKIPSKKKVLKILYLFFIYYSLGGVALYFLQDYILFHPVTLKSKERLRKRFGKYAPVVADVFYDHFLALDWEEYSEMSLRAYADQCYKFLETHYPIFPERTKQFFNYMVKYDILFAYSKVKGIDKVMQGMSRRASFTSGMEKSAEELVRHYEDYHAEFNLFFPDLKKAVLNQTRII